MATKIATLKPATPLVNAVGVWEFSRGIAIAEEDEQGNALVADAVFLTTVEEEALLDLLAKRQDARRTTVGGINSAYKTFFEGKMYYSRVKYNEGGVPYVEAWRHDRGADHDGDREKARQLAFAISKMAG